MIKHISMKKYIPVLLALLVLAGCAREYESNMQARKEIAWSQATNQRMAVQDVMAVVAKILNPFEEQAIIQAQQRFNEQPVVLGSSNAKTPVGDNYAMYLFAETMGKMIEQQGQAEIMRARAQAINFMVPIIQAIYAQNMADFGTPMSSNDVWAKLVGNIPFVATVGGMYALGAKGIDAAGDTITATLSEGSTLNNRGSQATGGSLIGDGSISESSSSSTLTVDKSSDNSQKTETGE
ncbi:MAG: hypothetical protein DRQ46_01595 [Gammaproteobacteria bacterium]|nr:MAG: hypothetical protein DRQ46_01595 [Gammaproteobacteria bacterium]